VNPEAIASAPARARQILVRDSATSPIALTLQGMSDTTKGTPSTTTTPPSTTPPAAEPVLPDGMIAAFSVEPAESAPDAEEKREE
jgi:hypothetical protein